MTDHKSKSEQFEATEQRNQELKAKIICLDQNMTDKQMEVEVLQRELTQQRETQTEREDSLEERIEELKKKKEEVSKKIDDEKENLEGQVAELRQQNAKLTSELEEISDNNQDEIVAKLSEEMVDLKTR